VMPRHRARCCGRAKTVTGLNGCGCGAGGTPRTVRQTAPCGFRVQTVTGLNGCGLPPPWTTGGGWPVPPRHCARCWTLE
jgi:hypothetical protein